MIFILISLLVIYVLCAYVSCVLILTYNYVIRPMQFRNLLHNVALCFLPVYQIFHIRTLYSEIYNQFKLNQEIKESHYGT